MQGARRTFRAPALKFRQNKKTPKRLFLFSESGKLFAVLFCQNAQENNADSKQCSQYVHVNHKVVYVHKSYSLVKNKPPPKNIADKTKPETTVNQSVLSLKSGPIKTVAKKICPISQEISESFSILAWESLMCMIFIFVFTTLNISKYSPLDNRRRFLLNWRYAKPNKQSLVVATYPTPGGCF